MYPPAASSRRVASSLQIFAPNSMDLSTVAITTRLRSGTPTSIGHVLRHEVRIGTLTPSPLFTISAGKKVADRRSDFRRMSLEREMSGVEEAHDGVGNIA